MSTTVAEPQSNAEIVAVTGDWIGYTEALMRGYFALLDDPNVQISGPLSLASYVVESLALVQLLDTLLGRSGISLDTYRDDLKGQVQAALVAMQATEPANAANQAIAIGGWVQQAQNIGQIAAKGQYLAAVRWINNAEKFRHTKPVLVDLRGLTPIDEPRLTRQQAIDYSGHTSQWLYLHNRKGTFSNKPRSPFWVYPSELDRYLDDQAERAQARQRPE